MKGDEETGDAMSRESLHTDTILNLYCTDFVHTLFCFFHHAFLQPHRKPIIVVYFESIDLKLPHT